MKKLFTNPYDPYEDHDRWSRYELKRATVCVIIVLVVVIAVFASGCTKSDQLPEPAPADKRIQDTVQKWQGWGQNQKL